MAKQYWLMKVEPSAYTIDDLEKDGTTNWEGVRNYKARNYMKDDMQVGDAVLFYASNAEPSGVTGLAKIVKAGYPDASAFGSPLSERSMTWPMIIRRPYSRPLPMPWPPGRLDTFTSWIPRLKATPTFGSEAIS